MFSSGLQTFWGGVIHVDLSRKSKTWEDFLHEVEKKKGKTWMFSQEQGRLNRDVLSVWLGLESLTLLGWLHRLEPGVVSGVRPIIWEKFLTNGLPQEMQCSRPV